MTLSNGKHGNISLEDALDLVYKGQTNIAVIAKKVGVTLEEMQRLFNLYAKQRPIDPDIWQADVELGWPWA
tara:strand:- start:2745 stop:2957 length:213 start_codon:yes stop_codon:yes gene_type:complete